MLPTMALVGFMAIGAVILRLLLRLVLV